MTWYETPVDPDRLPDEPGSYVLEFRLERPVELESGRFEGETIGPGRVRYYGSAHGPGGLAARVARHLDEANDTLHWHVDYLTAVASVARVYAEPGAEECRLAARDRGEGDWRVAIPDFGATDCSSCEAHLLMQPGSAGD